MATSLAWPDLASTGRLDLPGFGTALWGLADHVPRRQTEAEIPSFPPVLAKKTRLPMSDRSSKTIWANMVWLGLCCATSVGCGGGSSTLQAGPLKDREAIVSGCRRA